MSIEIGKHIKILEERIKKQDKEICDLKSKNFDLEHRVTELEQYSRIKSLKIEGIPEINDEDTFETVLDVCQNLKLDPPMELNDIDNCHRVGRAPTNGRPRAIIVKLSSYRARRCLYDARTKLADHNKRVRRLADTDEVFHEAGTEPREVPPPAEPPEQHAGRRPGSRATTRNTPVSEANPDSPPNHDAADQTIEFPSKWPIYINEALCKSRSKLSFAARDLKRNGKIHDTWTVDGRIKIKTKYNRIKNIETMAELEEYIWKPLYSYSQICLNVSVLSTGHNTQLIFSLYVLLMMIFHNMF